MNENVTIKTPKKRRWIARLLVSALCILLASSLLFVSVVAENVNSFSYVDSEYDSTSVMGFYFDDVDNVSCCVASLVSESLIRVDLFYIDNPVPFFSLNCQLENVSSLWAVSSNPNWIAISYLSSDGFIYVSVFDYSSSLLKTDFISGIIPQDKLAWFVYYNNDSIVCFCAGKESEADSTSYFLYEPNGLHSYTVRMVLIYGDSSWNVVPCADTPAFKLSELSFYSVNSSANSVPYVKRVIAGKSVYGSTMTSGGLRPLSISGGVVSVGDSLGNYFGLRAFRNFIVSSDFLSSNSFNSSFIGLLSTTDAISFVYATSSEYVPPESSDETTTEPPPESSEGSSADPSAVTKIWKVDRGLVESYAGFIDLTDATRIRAFLGVFTSSGSSFASDRAVPLTIEVYRNGLDSPDTFTFDFFAYGWGATSNGFPNSYDSYTFPDVVGLYYDIPIPADGEGLLFPTFAPYGSIYVNFSDSVFPDDIQRVTFNLHNSQGYLDVNFTSSSSTSFTIYNDDLTKGKTYTFDSGTFNYKCFFDLDGEYSETEWFSPQFGSSIKYSAEDVLESGLYAIYSFNDESIEYPWGNGEWSEAISNANSRLDQVSLDYEILESKANEAYGQFSFNSMTGQDFIGAVSNFESIKDSSGGSYILDYFFGMWNVHPFASSMIAIVGTLAIVGFIIRKL